MPLTLDTQLPYVKAFGMTLDTQLPYVKSGMLILVCKYLSNLLSAVQRPRTVVNQWGNLLSQVRPMVQASQIFVALNKSTTVSAGVTNMTMLISAKVLCLKQEKDR